MRTADLTTALILMAGGLLVIWDALRLGIGWGTDGPKSGFFPFWLAVFLLATCAIIARRRGAGRPAALRHPGAARAGPQRAGARGGVRRCSSQFVGLYVAAGALHRLLHALGRPLRVGAGGRS